MSPSKPWVIVLAQALQVLVGIVITLEAFLLSAFGAALLALPLLVFAATYIVSGVVEGRNVAGASRSCSLLCNGVMFLLALAWILVLLSGAMDLGSAEERQIDTVLTASGLLVTGFIIWALWIHPASLSYYSSGKGSRGRP